MKKVFKDQYEVELMFASNGEIFARHLTSSRPSRPCVPEPKEKASARQLSVNPELQSDGMAKIAASCRYRTRYYYQII